MSNSCVSTRITSAPTSSVVLRKQPAEYGADLPWPIHFFFSSAMWNTARRAKFNQRCPFFLSKALYFTRTHFNLPVTPHKSTRPGAVQHSWFKKSNADSTASGYCKRTSPCADPDRPADAQTPKFVEIHIGQGCGCLQSVTNWALAARLIISVNNWKTLFPRPLLSTILEGAHHFCHRVSHPFFLIFFVTLNQNKTNNETKKVEEVIFL